MPIRSCPPVWRSAFRWVVPTISRVRVVLGVLQSRLYAITQIFRQAASAPPPPADDSTGLAQLEPSASWLALGWVRIRFLSPRRQGRHFLESFYFIFARSHKVTKIIAIDNDLPNLIFSHRFPSAAVLDQGGSVLCHWLESFLSSETRSDDAERAKRDAGKRRPYDPVRRGVACDALLRPATPAGKRRAKTATGFRGNRFWISPLRARAK